MPSSAARMASTARRRKLRDVESSLAFLPQSGNVSILEGAAQNPTFQHQKVQINQGEKRPRAVKRHGSSFLASAGNAGCVHEAIYPLISKII